MITVASLLQIIDLLDSSRDLQHIYVKSFVNRLHLLLHVCVKKFDVIFFLRLRGLQVKM